MAGAVKSKQTAIITIIVTLAVVVVINLLSLNIFSRLDLTENKIYSISETSKKVVKNLDDRMTIKVFFTEGLPAPHNSDRRYLQDLLDDFKTYSNGLLHYEFLDPNIEKNRQEAARYQLQPKQFTQRGSTKAEAILGYKAIVVLYGGAKETLPFIWDMNTFEYEFIRMIKKLINPQLPRVGFATGHGELELNQGLTTVNQILAEDFEVVPVNLRQVPEIPFDIEALIFSNPKLRFSDREVYMIDQFIVRGGKVGFFVNGFNIDEASQSVNEVNIGLDSLLNYYGVGIKRDFVIDQNCYRHTSLRRVEGGVVPEMMQVPFFINILNFNEENITTKYQNAMSFIGASSIDTTYQLQPGLKREVLLTTSSSSGSLTGDIRTALNALDESSYDTSFMPLAVVVSGRFKSYYVDRPVPLPEPDDTLFVEQLPEKITEGLESRILVIGNGLWFDDNSASDRSGKFRPNFGFFLNVIDWMAQDEDMISIRSKGNIYNPITRVLSDSAETTLRIINVFLIPFLVIVFGIIRWQTKRAAKRRAIA